MNSKIKEIENVIDTSYNPSLNEEDNKMTIEEYINLFMEDTMEDIKYEMFDYLNFYGMNNLILNNYNSDLWKDYLTKQATSKITTSIGI